MASGDGGSLLRRCERSEAIQECIRGGILDCFVARTPRNDAWRDTGYTVSSALPRTSGPNSAMAITTISIATVIRPNTPMTPVSFSM